MAQATLSPTRSVANAPPPSAEQRLRHPFAQRGGRAGRHPRDDGRRREDRWHQRGFFPRCVLEMEVSFSKKRVAGKKETYCDVVGSDTPVPPWCLRDFWAAFWVTNQEHGSPRFPQVSSRISEAIKTPVTAFLVVAGSVESGSNYLVHHSQLTECWLHVVLEIMDIITKIFLTAMNQKWMETCLRTLADINITDSWLTRPLINQKKQQVF